jgi:hypothetical protein
MISIKRHFHRLPRVPGPGIKVERYIVNPFISSRELGDWVVIGRNDEPGNRRSVKVHPDSPEPSDRPT